jgi:hypothetical protein
MTIIGKNSVKMFVFEDVKSYVTSAVFNDLTYLLFESFYDDRLPLLPPNLQILICNDSKVIYFPVLPVSITNVFFSKGKLETLPDMSGLINLEHLCLKDNYIRSIEYPLAPNLRTLDVSFNKLRTVQCSLPLNLASVNFNFNFMMHHLNLPLECSVQSDHMYDDSWLMQQQKDRFVAATVVETGAGAAVTTTATVYARPLYNPMPKHMSPTNLYENKQNVHAYSVQSGVSNSVAVILNKSGNALIDNPHLVRDVLAIYKKNTTLWKKICNVFRTRSMQCTPPLYNWCNEQLIHSIHGITFRELLLRVWLIIEQHEHRDALHDILRDELNASIGVCFTGRFSRVVNVLNGFIDGVNIGISSSEQMQSRISHAVKMGQKENKTNDAIKAEVALILDEFKIEQEHARQAWLDAVE